MSTQEIQDYKLNWLRKKCFQVKAQYAKFEEYDTWLNDNFEEKEWEKSINQEKGEATYYFEKSQTAEKFREQFLGDSRTVDTGQ
jgi:predicted RNA-binding protein with PIN domain